jgi:TolB-like protein
VVVGLIVVVAGVLGWWLYPSFRATPERRLSLVVLPFTNLSGDKEQDYFADAITEDLITDLSRIRGAFVIARATSFTYKGKPTDARQIAADLGVRYLLEGSVRRSDQRVRVNAQLIDGAGGAHLWAEKFDRRLEDVIDVQSAITGHIASVLRAELLEAESRISKPANLEAWDYALQGTVKLHNRSLGQSVLLEAQQLFEKALALDPSLSMAWEGISFIHFTAATREIPEVSQPNSGDLALEAAQNAVAAEPRSSNAHRVLGLAYYWKGEATEALEACQRALDLNRNNDLAIICLSRAKFSLGNLTEANHLVLRSIELNPLFQTWLKNFYIGTGYFYLGEYSEAVRVLSKATSANPSHASVKLYFAASLAMDGDLDKAKSAFADYLKLSRGKRDTIEKVRLDRAHVVPEFERLATALRRLGMPEK